MKQALTEQAKLLLDIQNDPEATEPQKAAAGLQLAVIQRCLLMMAVTRAEFYAYCRVQKSGVTNMHDVAYVAELSGVEEARIFIIQKAYNHLKECYGEV